MSTLPKAPDGQCWIIFEDGRVAFLAPVNFKTHREPDDTVAVYPPGDSGITLRFSLHTKQLQPQMPEKVAEEIIADYSLKNGLEVVRLADRVYLTENREADWPDRRVLVHHWQIGVGRILVVGTATIWGADRETETIKKTLAVMPQIIESLRLT
jgi:hypothetical protein